MYTIVNVNYHYEYISMLKLINVDIENLVFQVMAKVIPTFMTMKIIGGIVQPVFEDQYSWEIISMHFHLQELQ